jgi:hypothetical protein
MRLGLDFAGKVPRHARIVTRVLGAVDRNGSNVAMISRKRLIPGDDMATCRPSIRF